MPPLLLVNRRYFLSGEPRRTCSLFTDFVGTLGPIVASRVRNEYAAAVEDRDGGEPEAPRWPLM
jgi:hypothetical protein